jgi:hypothetical protein
MHWKPDHQLYPPYLKTRIERGRGVWKGVDYKPWLKLRDVPSSGTSSSVSGIKIPRPYNFLSELETTYFYLVERKASTIDIQEQWPILDIDRTLELCSEYGVRHAYRGMNPEPFTIDFLITSADENQKLTTRAASIKTPDDAKNPLIRQRLLIEFLWCKEKEIPWTLIDTTCFTKTLLENLRFIRSWHRHRYLPNPEAEALFIQQFNFSYGKNVLLNLIIVSIAKKLRITTELTLDRFRFCAWSDQIQISLEHPIGLDKPIILKRDNLV